MLDMEFSEKLKELRTSKELTQEELASKVYISRSVIAKYERGFAIPTKENALLLADFFNVKITYLLTKDELRKIALNESKSQKIISFLLPTLFLIINTFILFFFFPSLDIYGFTHQVQTSYDPILYITITETSLINVLNSDYYSPLLKIAYVINFIFQIMSIISSIILLLIIYQKKYSFNKLYIFTIPSIILGILLIVLFNRTSIQLVIGIIFLIISTMYFIYLLVSNKSKTNIKK